VQLLFTACLLVAEAKEGKALPSGTAQAQEEREEKLRTTFL
jgi:hypothetical protein